MKTKTKVKADFLTDLNDLLLKYGAEISAEDHWQGYPECGKDIRIEIEIPGEWDKDGECVSEDCYIDLGRYITGSPKED